MKHIREFKIIPILEAIESNPYDKFFRYVYVEYMKSLKGESKLFNNIEIVDDSEYLEADDFNEEEGGDLESIFTFNISAMLNRDNIPEEFHSVCIELNLMDSFDSDDFLDIINLKIEPVDIVISGVVQFTIINEFDGEAVADFEFTELKSIYVDGYDVTPESNDDMFKELETYIYKSEPDNIESALRDPVVFNTDYNMTLKYNGILMADGGFFTNIEYIKKWNLTSPQLKSRIDRCLVLIKDIRTIHDDYNNRTDFDKEAVKLRYMTAYTELNNTLPPMISKNNNVSQYQDSYRRNPHPRGLSQFLGSDKYYLNIPVSLISKYKMLLTAIDIIVKNDKILQTLLRNKLGLFIKSLELAEIKPNIGQNAESIKYFKSLK